MRPHFVLTTPRLSAAILPLITALILLPAALTAEPVRAACLASDRDARDARLCKCIQVAADATLDRQEQSLAATFFADPHQAQVIRQSKDRSHGLFWERYKDFSALAEAFCES